jgi:hypothetical protein
MSWLADALNAYPLNRGKNSNILRLYNGDPPPLAQCSRIMKEIEPNDEGTETLTWFLIKRLGRATAANEKKPFRVSVKFSDGDYYYGLLTVLHMPGTIIGPGNHIVQIEFDDGEVEMYTQEELYMEIYGK